MQFCSKGIWYHRQPIWYIDIFPKLSAFDEKEEFRLFPSAYHNAVRQSNVFIPRWDGHTSTATE